MPPDAPTGFVCTGCGDCCRWPGHVLLMDADITRLASTLGLDEPAFIARHARLASNRVQLSLIEASDGSCEFLRDGRCTVYDARPQQCRDFPHLWRVDGCRGNRSPPDAT